MLTPPEVIDSIVVHELCHRKEMNHSDKFYAEVLRVFPMYWEQDKWLKENSEAAQENVPNGTPERKEEQEERFLESVRQFWVSGQSTVRTDVSPPPE